MGLLSVPTDLADAAGLGAVALLTGVGDCGRLLGLGTGDRAAGLVACRRGDLVGRVGDCAGLRATCRAVARVMGEVTPTVFDCADWR